MAKTDRTTTARARDTAVARGSGHRARPSWPRCPMTPCSKPCSGRPFASSGKAGIRQRLGARPAPHDASESDDPVATGGSGFGVMALIVAVERGWVRAMRRWRARRACSTFCARDLLSRRFPAFHESAHRCHHSVLPQGRWRRSGRDLLPVHGAVVRAAVLRSRHRGGMRLRGLHQRPVGGGRMELVHPGRPPGAVLALESQQRLGPWIMRSAAGTSA